MHPTRPSITWQSSMAHRQALSALVYLTLILLPSTSDADSPGGALMLSGNGSGLYDAHEWPELARSLVRIFATTNCLAFGEAALS